LRQLGAIIHSCSASLTQKNIEATQLKPFADGRPFVLLKRPDFVSLNFCSFFWRARDSF